ncbi:hypothetical protein ABT324_02965 [Saccharopolyspora sp. NPDC000359]|uniref:hypothetical protein n=1 Tax=Saccharopolyspora sp. NPDC000359 TaxID=3154251 RepID=UPI0033199BEE
MQTLFRKAEDLQAVEGLGDYASVQELANKFALKANNGETGAGDLLMQLSNELIKKADLFRQATRDYVATDEQIGEDMQRGSQA